MISRKLGWFIALSFAGLLIITWWAGRYPARIVVINQTGPLRAVTLQAGGRRFEIGELRRGATHTLSIAPGQPIELRYTSSTERVWRSIEPIKPAQAVVLYIRPNERVEVRRTVDRVR